MIKFIREFRIIPMLLIAASCLAVLKIAGLLLDGGYIFNDQPAQPAKVSWAEDVLNFPTGRPKFADDITGSVEAKPETKPAAVAAETRPVDVTPDPAATVSPSERAVLERLQARRQELEARAREVDIRENLVKAAEKRLDGKMEDLKATESRITVADQQKNEAEAARFKGLIMTYENMKPKDAAKVFDRLDIAVLYQIASQIAPRKMSDILGQMQPEAAERLTIEMARHASTDKSSSTADLPKIEGRPQRVSGN